MAGLSNAQKRRESLAVAGGGPEGLILFEAVGFGSLQDDRRYRLMVGGRLRRPPRNAGLSLGLLPAGLWFPNLSILAAPRGLRTSATPARCDVQASASSGDTFVGTFETTRRRRS